jgi:hypothetical protein
LNPILPQLNGCKNVKDFNFALGSKEGWGFLKVRIRKLDEVLKGERMMKVDMVKIDVGANLKACRFNPIHRNIIFVSK